MSVRRPSLMVEQHVMAVPYSGGRRNSLRYMNKFYAKTAPRRHSFHMCGQPPPAFTLAPKKRFSSLSEAESPTRESEPPRRQSDAGGMHFEKEVHDVMIAVENHNETRLRQILLIHTQIAPIICATPINNLAPLHMAAWNGTCSITKIMLNTGADANSETTNPTSLHYDVMTEMEFSAGSTPLHFACAKGHEEDVTELINHGADVNRCDVDGNSPTQKATVMGHLDIVKILLQNKAVVNVEDSFHQTPLHWAVYRRKLDIVKLLLRNGANPNHVSENGRTPLHTAARRCYLDAVVTLLDAGANLNLQDKQGQTPLHLATLEWLETSKGEETVKLLIDSGCDMGITDNQSHTAQHYAGEQDLNTIVAKKVKKTSRASSVNESSAIKTRNKKTDKNGCVVL